MSQILLQPANAMITLENVNKWYGQFEPPRESWRLNFLRKR
ncbi:hypothetical protein ESSG_02194 [Escherichia coli H730]|nr:hypothetical protein ESSG_02194 [Escherichia coli H730]